MLFALFFGAGNLIFPPFFGAERRVAHVPGHAWIFGDGCRAAGSGRGRRGAVRRAAAAGQQVGRRFALVFTVLIYLSIGPGLGFRARRPFRSRWRSRRICLMVRTQRSGWRRIRSCFFLVALWLCLNPGKLVDRIGRGLTPALLVLLAVLLFSFLFRGKTLIAAPQEAYRQAPFLKGALRRAITRWTRSPR